MRAVATPHGAATGSDNTDAQSAAPLVVATGGGLDSARTIRAAAGLARELGVPWHAVHIRRPDRDGRRDEFFAEQLDRALVLAERLGARTAVLDGPDIADALLDFARNAGARLIVVGPSRHAGLVARLTHSVPERLRRLGHGIEIRVLPSPDRGGQSWRAYLVGDLATSAGLYPYFLATLLTLVGAAITQALQQLVGNFDGLAVPMLAAVLFIAVQYGTWPGLFAAVLGGVIFAVFLTPPGARIGEAGNLTALVLFVAVGLLASHLAGRIREKVQEGRRREARLRALFRLSRDMAAAAGSQDILRAIVHQIDDILGARTVVMLPTGPEGLLQVSYPPGAELSPADAEAAEWAYHYDDVAGRGTHTVEEAERLYHPLRAQSGPVGVLGMGDADDAHFRDPEYRWLIDSLATLAASAIERMNLARRLADARVVAEADSLRAALLSSISHDLRTPLATIIGSASTLQRYGANLDEPTRLDLLIAIREEAERLNRFIRNLLDMTKIESGAIVPRRQWVALADILGSALERLDDSLDRVDVRTEIAPDLPLAYVDFVLMEQAIVNLIENAVKYSPQGGQVDVSVATDPAGERFRVAVTDRGIGIAAKDLAHIFDKFYRARSGDRRSAGTGLGLSICKGLVEAHGGTVHAQSAGEGMGSRFWIELPLERPEVNERGGLLHAERN